MKKSRNQIIRIFIFMLTALVVLSSFCFSSFAKENSKTVKVGFYTDRPKYMKAESNGTMREGYGYEYVWLVSNYSDWNVEYVFGTAKELNSKLLNGEIDLLPFTSFTEKNSENILFPEYSMGTEQYFLYLKKEADSLTTQNLSILNSKIIGVVSDSNEEEVLNRWLSQEKIECNVLKFENEFQRNNALRKEMIDLIADASQDKTKDMNTVLNIGSSDLYLAVSAENSDLLSELNNALRELYSLYPELNLDLYNKYYTQNINNVDLSIDETKWFLDNPVIKIGYCNKIIKGVEVNKNEATGFLPDLIKKISHKLGVNIKAEYIEYESDKELHEALSSNTIQIAYPVIADIYAGELSDYLPTHMVDSASMCIVTKNNIGTYTINSISETGNISLQYFSKLLYPNAEIVQSNSISNSLRMLKNGTVEGVIMPMKSFNENVKDSYEYGSLYATNISKPYEAALGINKSNRELWTLLERTLSSIGVDELNAISNKNSVQSISFSLNDVIQKYYWVLILAFVVGSALVIIIFIGKKQSKQKEIQNEILSAANKKAEFASKAKSDFLFNMSHDIRTPMNAIINFTDKAIDNADDKEKVLESLNKVKISSNMLLNIINDILDMSRIESEKAVVKEEKHNIRNSFDGISAVANELASVKDIEVSFEFGEIQNDIYYSDFSLIERVLLNIVSNAIKYTEKGGYVKVKVDQIDQINDTIGVYRYTVEDNGIGMSEEFQKHCFEQYTREQNSTVNSIQGTGLGLALAYSIVKALHGTITCESKQGVGSKFTVTLPFTISKQSAEEFILEEKKYDYSVLSGKRALLVEDNEFNREIMEDILSEKGILVTSATNGKEAVDIVKNSGENYFDFILMDIHMPVMDGYEATKNIRSSGPSSDIPIIAISANAFEEDKQKSYAHGMNAHIAKPLNKKVMLDTITELISKNIRGQ